MAGWRGLRRGSGELSLLSTRLTSGFELAVTGFPYVLGASGEQVKRSDVADGAVQAMAVVVLNEALDNFSIFVDVGGTVALEVRLHGAVLPRWCTLDHVLRGRIWQTLRRQRFMHSNCRTRPHAFTQVWGSCLRFHRWAALLIHGRLSPKRGDEPNGSTGRSAQVAVTGVLGCFAFPTHFVSTFS